MRDGKSGGRPADLLLLKRREAGIRHAVSLRFHDLIRVHAEVVYFAPIHETLDIIVITFYFDAHFYSIAVLSDSA